MGGDVKGYKIDQSRKSEDYYFFAEDGATTKEMAYIEMYKFVKSKGWIPRSKAKWTRELDWLEKMMLEKDQSENSRIMKGMGAGGADQDIEPPKAAQGGGTAPKVSHPSIERILEDYQNAEDEDPREVKPFSVPQPLNSSSKGGDTVFKVRGIDPKTNLEVKAEYPYGSQARDFLRRNKSVKVDTNIKR